MNKLYAVTAALLTSTALAATPAMAAEKQTDLAKQVQMLQDQLRTMQQQMDALRSSDQATRASVAQEKEIIEAERKARAEKEMAEKEQAIKDGAKTRIVNGKTVLTPAPLPKIVEPANHRFQFSSADGAWTIAPTGRVHFDYGGYLNQKPETAQAIGVGENRLTSGTNVRRGRVGVTGKAMSDFTYTFTVETGGSSDTTNTASGGAITAVINQAQLSYTGFRNTSIDFGYFAQYFVMEEAMSSNDILFMERATPATLASSFGAGDPRFGFGFRTWEPRWFFAAYITGTQPGVRHDLTYRNWNAFVRGSYQLVQEDTRTLHIGAGAISTLQVPNGGPPTAGVNTARTIGFSDRPELRVDPTALLNTGALGTVANPRVHASTGRVVNEAFAEERPTLQVLPLIPFGAVLKLERRISHEGMVSVGGNYYSVPDVTRRRVVEVHSLADEIRIFEEDRLIASHPLLEGRRQRSLLEGHRRQYRPKDESPIPHGFSGELVTRRSLDFYAAIGQQLAMSGAQA